MLKNYWGDIQGTFLKLVQNPDDAVNFGIKKIDISFKECGCETTEYCECTITHIHNKYCTIDCNLLYDENIHYSPECYKFIVNDDNRASLYKELSICYKFLKEWKKQLDKFFSENEYWEDYHISRLLGLPDEEVDLVLKMYARIILGEKILDCLNKKEICIFYAEV